MLLVEEVGSGDEYCVNVFSGEEFAIVLGGEDVVANVGLEVVEGGGVGVGSGDEA